MQSGWAVTQLSSVCPFVRLSARDSLAACLSFPRKRESSRRHALLQRTGRHCSFCFLEYHCSRFPPSFLSQPRADTGLAILEAVSATSIQFTALTMSKCRRTLVCGQGALHTAASLYLLFDMALPLAPLWLGAIIRDFSEQIAAYNAPALMRKWLAGYRWR